MATTFAMEKINDEKKKIVLIAPAAETASQVDIFFKMLHLSDSFRNFFNEEILRTRDLPVSWYSSIRAVKNFNAPILWIHDTDDNICPYKDIIDLQKENLPHIKFITTNGLGHNKIYRDAGVQKLVIDFLLQ
jgi:pimeloyl-ACP methyl ester carboxylesterase